MSDLKNIQLPSIEDIRLDFAKYPILFVQPEEGALAHTLQIKHEGIREFPNLSLLIDSANKDANEASLLDQPIPKPDVIEITNNTHEDAARFIFNDIGTPTEHTILRINVDAFKNLDSYLLKTIITHEFGHSGQRNRIVNASNSELQQLELEADRTVKSSFDGIQTFLAIKELGKIYNAADSDADHPNYRTRIEALLEKVYGDGIFKNSGEFAADHHFHPARQDGFPVTEEGYKLTNWDEKISPNIKKWVAEDMKYLDAQVNAGMDTKKSNDFIDREISRVTEFKSEFKVEGELASPKYIASHFAESLKDKNKIEVVIAMHPNMINVYKAFSSSVNYAVLHLSTEEHRRTFVNCVANNLVEGVRSGELLNNTNQSKIDADMQNACHVK